MSDEIIHKKECEETASMNSSHHITDEYNSENDYENIQPTTSAMKDTLNKMKQNRKTRVYGTYSNNTDGEVDKGTITSTALAAADDNQSNPNIDTNSVNSSSSINDHLQTNEDYNDDDGSISTVACEMNEDDIFGDDMDVDIDDENFDVDSKGDIDHDAEDNESSNFSNLENIQQNDDDDDDDDHSAQPSNEEEEVNSENDEEAENSVFDDHGIQPNNDEVSESNSSHDKDDDEIVHDFTQSNEDLADNDQDQQENLDGHESRENGHHELKAVNSDDLDEDVTSKPTTTRSSRRLQNKREIINTNQGAFNEKEAATKSIAVDNERASNIENDDEEEKEDERLSNEYLFKSIKHHFAKCEDKEKLTIKDFRIMLESSLNTKLDKKQKKFMKKQLVALTQEEPSSYEEEEREGEEENSSAASEYEEKKRGKRSSKKRKKSQKQQQNKSDADDSDSESDSSRVELSSPTTRSKTKPKTSRKPSHLKIHLEMRRKKQLAEAKIRAEELQAAKEQKFNEEDQKRAQLIAQKFNTNTEEARIQRIEDRIGLLGRLKERRLCVLALNDQEMDDDDELLKLSSLSNQKESPHHLTVEKLQNKNIKVEIDEDSSDGSGDEDLDSDDELVIVGNKPSQLAQKENLVQTQSKRQSPKSVLDIFKMNETSARRPNQNIVAASFTNPRAALKNALRMKQYESGNKWLARELGYDKPEDHIRDCKLIESKKQKQIIAKEEHRLRQVNERNERLMAIVKGEVESQEVEQIGDEKDEDENQVRTIVNNEESDKEDEEDEELAMARAIESEQAASKTPEDETVASEDGPVELELTKDATQNEDKECDDSKLDVTSNDSDVETLIHDHTEPQQIKILDGKGEDEIILDATQKNSVQMEEDSKSEVKNEKENASDGEGEINDEHQIVNDDDEGKVVKASSEQDQRPKNARWKAMLEREKQILKKQKALRKGQIDDEAEEEEEEEGVAGLEDFGFTVQSGNKQDEDDDNEADEEDFENIVDEVSDGEGDEEAGDEARKKLQEKEEKLRHKEILRRIREGYDGKRGGVAGGSSKRGNLRFDQLVAADNKDDAKRLGLLNDDELDSEDEEANGSGEVEDEEVLIDKMLKDRYLNRPDLPEENFSDSEEENDVENDGNGKDNEDDEEDIEQERLAKRFAKRARMNRLIELYGDEKEFSQTRLLDEDENLRRELTKIKTLRAKTIRRWSSSSSFLGSSTNSQLSSTNSGKENSLPMGSSILPAVINPSSSRKRKTTFLGGGKEISRRSQSSKAVSLGHVVFSLESSSNNGSSSLTASSTSTIPSRSASLTIPNENKRKLVPPSRKRSVSDSGRKGSSLWAKVSATGFHKRCRR